jgi:hypothetical protein
MVSYIPKLSCIQWPPLIVLVSDAFACQAPTPPTLHTCPYANNSVFNMLRAHCEAIGCETVGLEMSSNHLRHISQLLGFFCNVLRLLLLVAFEIFWLASSVRARRFISHLFSDQVSRRTI